MYGGFSGSQGMIFYDTKKSGDNGVYGYYEEDEIVLMTGEYKTLREQQIEREKPYKREKDPLMKYMVMLFVLDLTAVVLAFVFGTFRIGAAVTVFAAGSFYPILVIGFAQMMDYQTEALHAQFRRFHGCEHQTVSWLTKRDAGEVLSVEKIQKERIYDSECGTAYAGYFLTLVITLSLLLLNIANLGLLKAIGILLAVIAVLVINIFNPYNPYLLLQKPVVAQPGEREYVLATAIAGCLLQRKPAAEEDDKKKV